MLCKNIEEEHTKDPVPALEQLMRNMDDAKLWMLHSKVWGCATGAKPQRLKLELTAW